MVSWELEQANKYYLQMGKGGQGDRTTALRGCRLCMSGCGSVLQATQWAGEPGREEPNAFRNCTFGLEIWWGPPVCLCRHPIRTLGCRVKRRLE